MRARDDGVLFHRRRHKECEVEPVAPVLPPAREYKVFLAHTDDEGLKQITNALGTGDVTKLAELKFEFIDGVTFAPGAAELASPVEEIRKHWSQASPGNKLLYAAIASIGAAAAEGRPLADERLHALVEVLPPVTALEGATLDVLRQIPAGLDPENKDGVCLLVTNKTTCLSVRGVKSVEDLLRLEKPIQTGDWGEALKASESIGDVAFWGEGSQGRDVAHDSLELVVTEWVRRYGQSGVGKGYCVSSPSAKPGQGDVDYQRATLVGTRLDVKEGVERVPTGAEFPKKIACRAVAFLAPLAIVPEPPKTTCLSVYSIGEGDMGKLRASPEANYIQQQLEWLIGPPARATHLGNVQFDESSNRHVEGTLTSVVTRWGQRAPGDAVVICHPDGLSTNVDMERGKLVYARLPRRGQGDIRGPVVLSGEWPSGLCRAVMFVASLEEPRTDRPRSVPVRILDQPSRTIERVNQPLIEVAFSPTGEPQTDLVEAIRDYLGDQRVAEVAVVYPEGGPGAEITQKMADASIAALGRAGMTIEGASGRIRMTDREKELVAETLREGRGVIVVRAQKPS